MEPFRHHIFVCTQEKPEGVTSCPGNGSLRLLQALERELSSQGLDNEVQVTTCGCLGLCDDGPIMIAYPGGVWYHKVKEEDVPEIVESHLRSGRVVSRLAWTDSEAMKAQATEHRDRYRAMVKARDEAGVLPDDLNEMIRAFMSSRAVLTALELDVFTAVGSGASAAQVAESIHADSRAAEMLLNALVALGLVTKSGGIYSNTADSARFFVRDSKDNHRNGLLHTANIWHRWSTLTDAVRHGTCIPIDRESTSEWTVNFIAGMDRNARARAPLVVQALGTAGVHRVLDLGGGSGAYSIAFAKASPDVRCEILDVPEVVPLTTEYVNKAGVSAQVSLRPGDMLTDDLGSGYDIIMLNAICHMFSGEQNQQLFRRARQALAPNGRLVVQDFILNSDKTGPLHAALFSLNMLVATDHGASYNENEYSSWMKNAGFADISRIKLPGPSDLIVAVAK